jgi:hypothetical protein
LSPSADKSFSCNKLIRDFSVKFSILKSGIFQADFAGHEFGQEKVSAGVDYLQSVRALRSH